MPPKTLQRRCLLGSLFFLLGMIASCKVTPDYQRPPLTVPTTYKSAGTQQSSTQPIRRDWWVLFNDADLTRLEEASLAHNPDLRAAMARVAEARAAAGQVKSQFYPQVALDPSVTWAHTGGNANGSGKATDGTSYRIPLDMSYEVDAWGKMSRSLESANAQTNATAAQYAVVLQTLEADVAVNYLNLRSLESQDEVFSRSVDLYRRQLDLINQKLRTGIVGQIDVAQAQVQLDQIVTQQIDIRRQRTDTEHALAILTGKPPTEFSVAVSAAQPNVPVIPPNIPADILRNRPDVATAEQNLIAANAQVGIALTAFYPTIQITGSAGFQSLNIQRVVDWEGTILSVGPSLSLPIFEGGRLNAQLQQARARYDELVATYESTILTAFRDVEISLTDIHMQQDALDAQHTAVVTSREYLRLAQVEYDQGIVSLLQLIDADRALLTNEVTEAQILNQRLVATVVLIKSLGTGWDQESSSTK